MTTTRALVIMRTGMSARPPVSYKRAAPLRKRLDAQINNRQLVADAEGPALPGTAADAGGRVASRARGGGRRIEAVQRTGDDRSDESLAPGREWDWDCGPNVARHHPVSAQG